MNERRVCTIELTEAEAIGLLHLARWGVDAGDAFGLSLPEGTTKHETQRAVKKLNSARQMGLLE